MDLKIGDACWYAPSPWVVGMFEFTTSSWRPGGIRPDSAWAPAAG